MTAVDINSLTVWITATAVDHPLTLIDAVARRLGVTRTTARRQVARLVAAQWLAREGSPRRPIYRPGLLRQVVQRYTLEGLDEATPWQRDFAQCLALPPALLRMVQQAFTELLNNAIDHSEGTSVTVSLRQTPSQVQLLVSDNGRGVFDKLGATFGLPDAATAMLELSKGKLTTAPAGHTGHGLYFTARMADVFDIHANGAAFQRRAWDASGWRSARPMLRRGTSVYAAFALDTPRSVDAVLQECSADGSRLRFERTQVPLRLLTSAVCGLESRAQARRVAARLTDFACSDIDFADVPHIGLAFADELFRVAARPGLALRPVNMTAAVAETVACAMRE